MTVTANGSARLDTAGIDALYRSDRARLLRIATRVAPTADAGEDAVQDAFVKLLADPARARIPEAFVVAEAKYGALNESRHRGRQKPAGDAIDRLADVAPDPDTDTDTAEQTPCLGDSATAAQVTAALATLPDGERQAVELHCLDGRPVSEVARELDVVPATVYARINRALARLRDLGVPLEPDRDPSPPRTRLDDIQALLGRVAAGRRVTWADAQEILRDHGLPRTSKVVAAAVRLHNEPLPADAPRYLDRADGRHTSKPPAAHKPSTAKAVRQRKPSIVRRAALLRSVYGTEPPTDLPGVSELARRHGWDGATASYARAAYIEGHDLENAPETPAPATAPPDPVVAEAWLKTADAQVTCMFVHVDESTATHPVTFASMPAAQREVTGLLIGRGYRPGGPWTDTGTGEAMRPFTTSTPNGSTR